MSDIDTLLAAIEKTPDDTASYLVLADALEQQGDPRGELITVQHKLAAGADKELAKREAALIEERRKKLKLSEKVVLAYRLGFLDRVKVAAPMEPDDMGKAIAAIFGSPDARLLRELVIDPGDGGRIAADDVGEFDDDEDEGDDDGETDDDPSPEQDTIKSVLEVIAKSKHPPPASLRRLVLGEAFVRDRRFRTFNDYGEMAFADNLSKVLDVFEGLRELHIDLGAAEIQLDPLESRTLERFSWISPFISDKRVRKLSESKLPALRAFSLGAGGQYLVNSDEDFDDPEQEEGVSVEAYEAILEMLDDCPHLRELGLPNTTCDLEALFDALGNTDLAKRIEILDLSHTDFDDTAALARLMVKMPALRELRLEAVDKKTREKLKSPNVKITGNASNTQRRFRYVLTME